MGTWSPLLHRLGPAYAALEPPSSYWRRGQFGRDGVPINLMARDDERLQ